MRMDTRSAEKNIGFGFFSISAWSFASALGYVYVGSAEQKISLPLFCFFLFLIPSLFFFMINLKQFPSLLKRIQPEIKKVIMLNVTTVGSWLFLTYPLKYVEPCVVSAIILGITPIFTLWISKYIGLRFAFHSHNYLIAGLLMMSVLYLITLCVLNKTTVTHITPWHVFLLMLSCTAASVSSAANTIYTKKLSQLDFTPVDILSMRFIFLIVLAGIAALTLGEFNKIEINSVMFSSILISASVLIIVPQIFFQLSVRELEPLSINIISPLMPVLIFFIELMMNHSPVVIYTLIGILSVCIISLGGSILRYQAERATL